MTILGSKISSVEIGRRFERDAERALESPLRSLVSRNFRCRSGEVDLIYEELRPSGRVELVFVEVRSRAQESLQRGLESVGALKRIRIIRAAREFLETYHGSAETIRFDVFWWEGSSSHHCEGAF